MKKIFAVLALAICSTTTVFAQLEQTPTPYTVSATPPQQQQAPQPDPVLSLEPMGSPYKGAISRGAGDSYVAVCPIKRRYNPKNNTITYITTGFFRAEFMVKTTTDDRIAMKNSASIKFPQEMVNAQTVSTFIETQAGTWIKNPDGTESYAYTSPAKVPVRFWSMCLGSVPPDRTPEDKSLYDTQWFLL